MSSVRPHQRFFALLMAILFLATAVAGAGIFVWQLKQEKQATPTEQITKQEATTLKGTKLADFTPITEAVTELKVIDIKVGDGEEAKASSTVTGHYTGAYAVNGEIFESSKDGGSPATFPLSGVIEGWQKGVPGMKVGGIRRLVIPGAMAYGEAPAGYKPGDGGRPMGPLVFDIELSAVQN